MDLLSGALSASAWCRHTDQRPQSAAVCVTDEKSGWKNTALLNKCVLQFPLMAKPPPAHPGAQQNFLVPLFPPLSSPLLQSELPTSECTPDPEPSVPSPSPPPSHPPATYQPFPGHVCLHPPQRYSFQSSAFPVTRVSSYPSVTVFRSLRHIEPPAAFGFVYPCPFSSNGSPKAVVLNL